MNFTCFLTIFKKAKPFFVFYDNAIHSYLVIRIWSDVDIPKTDICQFRIMIYAKQASARNKETSQWMIVTLIVFFIDYVFIIKNTFRVTINPDSVGIPFGDFYYHLAKTAFISILEISNFILRNTSFFKHVFC